MPFAFTSPRRVDHPAHPPLARPGAAAPAATRRWRTRLLGVAALCTVAGAQAAERPWAISLELGPSQASSARLAGGQLSTRAGPAYGGSISRRLGEDWRVGASVMYRQHPVSRISSPGFDPRPSDGELASVMLSLNLYRDLGRFQLGPALLRPYVGLGLGRAQEVDVDLSAAGRPREFSGSNRAWFASAGVNWDYSGPWSAGLHLSLADAGTLRFQPSGGGAAQDFRYRSTTLAASLGYRF